MNRKNFMKVVSAIPFFGLAFQAFGRGNSLAETCKTQRDQEGPFYKSDAPARKVIETIGAPLQITGKIFSGSDCESPVSNAVVDIWHCDNDGIYDMKGFKGRGFVKTDEKGNYSFTTILPPPYGTRPRHIHFKAPYSFQSEGCRLPRAHYPVIL